jgi:hypothetical protein
MKKIIIFVVLALFIAGCQAGPVVTLAEYDSIQDGMSYQQVCNTVGAMGVEVLQAGGSGYSTSSYLWVNSDDSRMSVAFLNGKMFFKAQKGLR